MDKVVLEEAERESLEAFDEVQKELRYYYQRVQLLEALLVSNGLSVPAYDN